MKNSEIEPETAKAKGIGIVSDEASMGKIGQVVKVLAKIRRKVQAQEWERKSVCTAIRDDCGLAEGFFH